MGKKIKSKTTTVKTEYEDRTVIITKVERQPDLMYFNGTGDITKWDTNGGYIDLAPKGNFITRFVKRLWNLKKLYKLLDN